jgi:hypothetical protein
MIQLDPSEHSAHLWLPIDKALDLASSWTNREAMRLLAASLGLVVAGDCTMRCLP